MEKLPRDGRHEFHLLKLLKSALEASHDCISYRRARRKVDTGLYSNASEVVREA